MTPVIIGAGRVGLCNALFLKQQQKLIYVVDKDTEIIEQLKNGIDPYSTKYFKQLFADYGAKIVFSTEIPEVSTEVELIFCIGGDIVEAVKEYHQKLKSNFTAIRGTLDIKQVRSLRNYLELTSYSESTIIFPEFMVEGDEIQGAVSREQSYYGTFTEDKDANRLVRHQLFALYPTDTNHIKCKAEEAVLAKSWTNATLAVRVALANTIEQDCVEQEINPTNVLNLIKKDPRIGGKYFSPSAGYGGSCLPFAMKMHSKHLIIDAVQDYNKTERPSEILDRLPPPYENVSVLFFGFNFKGNNVHDTRESAPLNIINEAKSIGYRVFVSDNQYSQEISSDIWVFDPREAINEIDCVVIFYQTLWLTAIEQYLEQCGQEDIKIWKDKIVVDFREKY